MAFISSCMLSNNSAQLGIPISWRMWFNFRVCNREKEEIIRGVQLTKQHFTMLVAFHFCLTTYAFTLLLLACLIRTSWSSSIKISNSKVQCLLMNYQPSISVAWATSLLQAEITRRLFVLTVKTSPSSLETMVIKKTTLFKIPWEMHFRGRL